MRLNAMCRLFSLLCLRSRLSRRVWCGVRLIVRSLKRMVFASKSCPAMCSVLILLCLLSGCLGSTYHAAPGVSEPDPPIPPYLLQTVSVAGVVPVKDLLDLMRREKVLLGYPRQETITEGSTAVYRNETWLNVIDTIEHLQGWVFDRSTRVFYAPSATHSSESPDSFGRPGGPLVSTAQRAQVSVRVRFVSVGAGVSDADAFVSGQFVDFATTWTAGVIEAPSAQNERSYFQPVVSAQSGTTLATTRATATAGTSLTGLASLLPGGRMRVDAQLEISNFVDSGLNKSTVSVPLQIDGDAGRWYCVYRQTALNSDVRFAWKTMGVALGAGGSEARVYVRVN